MGKLTHLYTDSETENNSSLENLKNKRKPSILKYTGGTVKKKKCKIHSKSEPEDSDVHSRSRSRSHSNSKVKTKLRGILKHTTEKERDKYYISSTASEEDEEPEPVPKQHQSRDRYLVGRVPRPAGAKPGRGGGVAIIVKKNLRN